MSRIIIRVFNEVTIKTFFLASMVSVFIGLYSFVLGGHTGVLIIAFALMLFTVGIKLWVKILKDVTR